MLRLAAFASIATFALVPACRYSFEDDFAPDADMGNISPSCMEATTRSDLAFIEEKVFATSCIFSGCHNGGNDDAGMMDLRAGASHAVLVGKPSKLFPSANLVVAGAPNQSYLMMMVKHFTPEQMSPPVDPPPLDIGFMPQNAGGASICVQKREAIERWITAGAMP